MYKAIHCQTGEEIIILSRAWLPRINTLRELDHADQLVCQVCQQPLRVKAGEVKRPHFAHKHLQACSLGTESPEILAARAVLYAWLVDRFGAAAGLEKAVPGLPRPVDGWVDTPNGGIAYWIIERGIKLEPREAIQAALAPMDARAHFVFLATMLNEEKKELHSLLLTPTEREFLRTTPYDQMLSGPGEVGASIHYLDAALETLTTYRSLVLYHRPNWFRGVKKTARLADIRAGRDDGTFIHPGEAARLRSFEQKRERLAQKRQRYEAQEAVRQESISRQQPLIDQRDNAAPAAVPYDVGLNAAQGQPELPCATCGQITADYWSTFVDDRGRKLCRCRECLARQA